jgi:hypothetical protein
MLGNLIIFLERKKNSSDFVFQMFVRPKDPTRYVECTTLPIMLNYYDREMWDGPRSGPEGAIQHFGAHKVGTLVL